MSKKLYIGNCSFSLTDVSLENLFSQCGTVESAKIITDRDSGRSKGFGFVEMSTPEEAKNAIEKINNMNVEGREIKVSEAKPQQNRSAERRGGRRY